MMASQGYRRGFNIETIAEVRQCWQHNGRGEVMLTRQGGSSETMLGANFIYKYKPVL